MLTSMPDNVIRFKPLGIVLALTLGIGLAEKAGMFEAAIQKNC